MSLITESSSHEQVEIEVFPQPARPNQTEEPPDLATHMCSENLSVQPLPNYGLATSKCSFSGVQELHPLALPYSESTPRK
jgi:hypothetical protein